tara:strand:+ start:2137 stop:2934 length:798 start_codon:yes stop_codon:yes gene_type:complete
MDIIKNKLDKFIKKNKIPNILFHGNSIKYNIQIMRYLLDKIYIDKTDEKTNTIYVNCAYGKGIKFIREQLKFFAKTNISIDDKQTYSTFKSIILINADFLTIDAQSALRRCIELYSHTTRFFIVVLNKDAIIKPIISRFCDIYIPCLNNIQYSTIQSQKCRNTKIRYIKKVFKEFDKNKEKNNDKWDLGKDIFDLTEELYKKGVYYYDFLECIRSSLRDDTEKYSLITYINKIRSEIKNEKLLIMNILNFYWMRHSLETENMHTI